MKKIFITGICGFVGSNLATFFYKKNYKVFGVDNLSREGSFKNYLYLKKKGIQVSKGNLCNDIVLKKILQKKNRFNVLIHCAGFTSVLDGTNLITTEQLYENNIFSTLNSLKIAKNFNSNFIYISSSRIYSIPVLNSLKLRFNEIYKPEKTNITGLSKNGINENFSTTSPVSLYGNSKMMCEKMIEEYCELNKINFVINRCGLLTGSGQLYKNDQGVVSFWINSWKKNKKLTYIGFNGRGFQTRDCLHPYDLADLINKQIKKIKKLKKNNKIFNVSGGPNSAFSLSELSNWCCKNISHREIKSAKKNRLFDVKWLILDNSKVRKEFKWKIKYSKRKIFQNILNEND